MRHENWKCPKCGNNDYSTGEIRVAGGFWSKIFDVQASKYAAVTCQRCAYTEFYKGSTSTLGSVFDFFTQ
ncbi:MAG: zinc ribbon domain-containing protein [Thermoanaerobaculia bacterium]